MSTNITEQEAREAAATNDVCERNFLGGKIMGMSMLESCGTAASTLIRFAKQELTRRDTERAEREKPIDAEWCVENGGFEHDYDRYLFKCGKDIHVEWNAEAHVAVLLILDARLLTDITTRGQLLDLLRALKSGAS